jgi:TatD DNase family protein
MRIFDIGANFVDPMFKGIYNGSRKHPPDLLAVIERSRFFGITDILLTSSNVQDVKNNVQLLRENNLPFKTTVGIHPCNAQQVASSYLEDMEMVFAENKQYISAFGECGLDYDRLNYSPKEAQLEVFETQLQLLAHFAKLPVFFHMRNAFDDFFRLVNKYRSNFPSGVVHSFDGTMEQAQKLVSLDLYIGLNGCSLKQDLTLACQLPLDRLMVESDAPWCSIKPTSPAYQHILTRPELKNKWQEGYAVKGRNEPWASRQVLEVIASSRGISLEHAADVIYDNSIRLFGIAGSEPTN